MKRVFAIVTITTFVIASIFATGAKESSAMSSEDGNKVMINSNTPKGDLEIFSWWAGDEGPALEALIVDFK